MFKVTSRSKVTYRSQWTFWTICPNALKTGITLLHLVGFRPKWDGTSLLGNLNFWSCWMSLEGQRSPTGVNKLFEPSVSNAIKTGITLLHLVRFRPKLDGRSFLGNLNFWSCWRSLQGQRSPTGVIEHHYNLPESSEVIVLLPNGITPIDKHHSLCSTQWWRPAP